MPVIMHPAWTPSAGSAIMRLSDAIDSASEIPERALWAVIRPMRTRGPMPKDNILPFGNTDYLAERPYDIEFDNIEETTVVFPINKNRTDPFPDQADDTCAIFVVP